MKYLGYYNNKWNFKRNSSDSYPTTVSIGKYKNGNSHNDQAKGELYDVAMLYMAGEIVANEKFNHTLLPIMFFDIKFKDLKKQNAKIAKQISDTDTSEHDIFYVLITEHYYDTITLNKYLEENVNNFTDYDWKVLFFQILYSLAKLSDRFNNFRHNKLDLDSICIMQKKDKSTKNYKYGNTNFTIPDVKFNIKLCNFFYSNTTDYLTNTDAPNTQDNPYYDIHYFFNKLLFKLQSMNYQLSASVMNFIKEIIPDRFMDIQENFSGLNEEEFNSMSSEIVISSTIIKKNKFFRDFIIDTMDLSASPVENNKINIKNIGKMNSKAVLSITEASSDEPRLLGRKVLSKKKKINGYSIMRGTRKITVPKFSTDTISELSEGGVSKKSNKRTANKDSHYIDEINRLKRKLNKHKKLNEYGGKRKSKSKRKSKKSKKKSRHYAGDSDSPDKKVKNNYNQYLDEDDRQKMNELPDGYFGEAPDYLKAKVPLNTDMPAMNEGNMGMMGNNYNPMMNMQNPQLSLEASDIMGANTMPQMMGQQMPPMMGGSKRVSTKYKIVNDKSKTQQSDKKDFFF